MTSWRPHRFFAKNQVNHNSTDLEPALQFVGGGDITNEETFLWRHSLEYIISLQHSHLDRLLPGKATMLVKFCL